MLRNTPPADAKPGPDILFGAHRHIPEQRVVRVGVEEVGLCGARVEQAFQGQVGFLETGDVVGCWGRGGGTRAGNSAICRAMRCLLSVACLYVLDLWLSVEEVGLCGARVEQAFQG